MVYKFFDKKSASLNKSNGSGIANKSASEPNYQLADELHKPMIKKFKKKKFIHFLKTTFGVLIKLICNHWANITKESNIYCVQLI